MARIWWFVYERANTLRRWTRGSLTLSAESVCVVRLSTIIIHTHTYIHTLAEWETYLPCIYVIWVYAFTNGNPLLRREAQHPGGRTKEKENTGRRQICAIPVHMTRKTALARRMLCSLLASRPLATSSARRSKYHYEAARNNNQLFLVGRTASPSRCRRRRIITNHRRPPSADTYGRQLRLTRDDDFIQNGRTNEMEWSEYDDVICWLFMLLLCVCCGRC